MFWFPARVLLNEKFGSPSRRGVWGTGRLLTWMPVSFTKFKGLYRQVGNGDVFGVPFFRGLDAGMAVPAARARFLSSLVARRYPSF